jgi:ubiquinone/menaquinone biosynthesis C-methylase UbiE
MTNPIFRQIVLAALCAAVSSSAFGQGRGSAEFPSERIFNALEVKEGATVGEIGAGRGQLSLEAAKIVGATGKVYTSELGDDRVRSLEGAVKKSGLAHVTVVAGDPNRTNFPDSCCDAIFMHNVYHHFDDPVAMNKSILQSLKPGGRVAIVDFVPNWGREAQEPRDRDQEKTHGVTADSVARELKEAGFEAVASEAGGDKWFIVVGIKPAR